MDTPPDSQRKAWARLSTLTSFVSRICFFKARCSDSDSVNGFIVIPPAFDFTRVRLGGVKKILSTYLVLCQAQWTTCESDTRWDGRLAGSLLPLAGTWRRRILCQQRLRREDFQEG